MPAWNDNRIPFDRLVMDHPGMAGCTTFSPASNPEGLHVFAMTHDETDFFHGRRQITRRHFRHSKNISMTAYAHIGVDGAPEIVRIGRSSKQIDRQVSCPEPNFVVKPAFNARSHVAGRTGHLFVRGLRPTVVGRSDGMAPGTELRLIGEGNGSATEHDCSSHENEYDRDARLPAHALIEHVEGTAS